jgi:DNA-binding CsgD family transcriptional regulator
MGPQSSEQRLADAASQLWAMDDLAEFRRGVLSVLHGLIDADIASYNEICRDPPEALVLAEPMDSLGGTGSERRRRFAELILQNPLAAHFVRTGDPSAQRMSDFISRRRFHALELYDLVYRETETDDQIAFTVPASGHLIGITMSRTREDFADHERDLLDRARHLIVPVHRNLLDHARLQVVLSALEGEGDRHGPAAVLLVHGSGALEPAHPYAERLLREIVRERSPFEALQAWGQRQRGTRARGRGREPLALALHSAGEVIAHYVHGRSGALDGIALYPSPRPTATALRSLGLTARQAAVLHLLWEGASNREIALALSISEHTVRHHLEEVYRRLNVRSRAAAAHVAGRAVREQPGRHGERGA